MRRSEHLRRTLASLYASEGKFNEAEGLLQQMNDENIKKKFTKDSIEAAETMVTLGSVEIDGQQLRKRRGWLAKKALEIQWRKLPAGHYKFSGAGISGDLVFSTRETTPRLGRFWRRSCLPAWRTWERNIHLTIAVSPQSWDDTCYSRRDD